MRKKNDFKKLHQILNDEISKEDPLIPCEVITSILESTGCHSPDHRVQKLISLAASQFIFDIGNDAMNYIQMQEKEDKVLDMNALQAALKQNNIDIYKIPYLAEKKK